MTPLNTNMRHIKRIPSDDRLVFALGDHPDVGEKDILCNYCGWRDKVEGYDKCNIYADIQERDAVGVRTIMRHCKFFQPILMFREFGEVGSDFNTFRLGSAWYNRVSPGSVCALYETTENRILGKAVVTATFHGSLEEMCNEHAVHNHALEPGMDPDEAATKMFSAISDAYSPFMGDSGNMKCSVIYLRQSD